MLGRHRMRSRTVATLLAVSTAGAGIFALRPGSLSHHIVSGTVFAMMLLNLLSVYLGPYLVRRAAKTGRLKGRHSTITSTAPTDETATPCPPPSRESRVRSWPSSTGSRGGMS
ncbi:hypothetical protein [Kitasatospora sp. NPDC057223]|uniref:hypothetical protein n=1 Tax=Kitasatospora sp. NPDC057223 TaxID=3346055 RepID=UPI003628536C